MFQVVGLELTLSRLKSYSRRKLLDFEVQKIFFADRTGDNKGFSKQNCLEATVDLASLIILSNTVHTRRQSS